MADLGGRETACEGAKTSCAVVHHFRRNQSLALVGFAFFSEVPGGRRFPKGDFRAYGRQGGSVK